MNESLSPLLSANETRAITCFAVALRQRFPERILHTVLFGSKARGDFHPGSDIDILIVVDNEDWRFQHTISTLAARISLEYDVLISPRVVGQERWQNMEQYGFSLFQTIATEGIPLDPTAVPS